jgi:hypothetical protein
MVDLTKYRDPRFNSPAIRIKSDHPDHEQGFFVINESDFDPKKHELWQPPGAPSRVQFDADLADDAPFAKQKADAKPAEPSKPVARADVLHLRTRP